jgi:hypothetical protein
MISECESDGAGVERGLVFEFIDNSDSIMFG